MCNIIIDFQTVSDNIFPKQRTDSNVTECKMMNLNKEMGWEVTVEQKEKGDRGGR
jgi:hypothetical protein